MTNGTSWHIEHREVDGPTLERWFLKTLINDTVFGKYRIGPQSAVVGEPSADLVQVAFGLREFGPAAGLYVSTETAKPFTFHDGVSIYPLIFEKQRIRIRRKVSLLWL